MPRPCIFCGKERRLSREHVFATWLENYFSPLGDAEYLRRLVTPNDDRRHNRPGPPFDFVSRKVCEVCNTGWMSDLETRVQPILGPMLTEQPHLITLLDQATLATWATKTMLAMQALNLDGETVFSEAQYRWFEKNTMPLPSSHVWLCRFQDPAAGRPVTAHQWGMSVGLAGGPPLSTARPLNGFGVTFAVGPVAFWLFGCDLPGAPQTNAGSDDAHRLIWPAVGSEVYWPPAEAIESDQALYELSRRMPAGTTITDATAHNDPGPYHPD